MKPCENLARTLYQSFHGLGTLTLKTIVGFSNPYKQITICTILLFTLYNNAVFLPKV
jgi:hypothetical protein